jgi:serine protease AprX
MKADLPVIDGFAVDVAPESLAALEELDTRTLGARFFIDERVTVPEPEGNDGYSARSDREPATVTMGVDKVWQRGITGKGVTIAIVDSGISPHPDLKDKIVGFYDALKHLPDPYDDDGHGTHVAGIAAGTGAAGGGRYRGAAPDAALVGVKVINEWGSSFTSTVLEGIQWVIDNREKYHIKVMNTSLSGKPKTSWRDDPLALAIEKVSEVGIIPVTTAGNRGPEPETVRTPGIAPDCITVGNLDDGGTVSPADDVIARKSSRGPTPIDGLIKPDVSAPGERITAADHASSGYVVKSGTSMASPFVAGCIALLAEVKPDITTKDVQDLLYRTGRRLPGVEAVVQGKGGVINPAKAVDAVA